MKSFVGLVGYYHQSMKDFVKRSYVLYVTAPEKIKLFQWTDGMGDAFAEPKKAPTSQHVLDFPVLTYCS